MIRWEYCQLSFSKGEVIANDEYFNIIAKDKLYIKVIADLGREGWEMCGILNGSGTFQDIIYFKRPLENAIPRT